jgi:hypothetical protein
MARRAFTLVDLDRNVHLREAAITPAEVPGAARAWSVRKRTLDGGLREGVEAVEIECGPLRATLLPTRGMGIWKAWWGDLELGWKSPARGPVHPKFVPLFEPGGLGWLRGFDELLCRCGLESNGAPEWDEHGQLAWPLHGRIANLPAHELAVEIDGDSGEIAVRGAVDETCLFGSKLRLVSTTIVRADSPRLQIRDEVLNLSGERGELELLYHVNLGRPILEAGSRLVLPAKELSPRDPIAAARLREWDRYGSPEPGRREEVFYAELHAGEDGRTRALIVAPGGGFGASLVWDAAALPCFTLWKNPQMAADGFVTGLEPGTNFPNRRSFEKLRGRVLELGPGERRSFALDLEIHPDRESVARAEAEFGRIAAGRTPLVHPDTAPRFAPL